MDAIRWQREFLNAVNVNAAVSTTRRLSDKKEEAERTCDRLIRTHGGRLFMWDLLTVLIVMRESCK